MAIRLTAAQRQILQQMAAGWRPFPFQLSGLENSLLKRGLVETEADERNRPVLILTESGQQAIKDK